MISCIDACLIPINTPARKARHTYTDRHGNTSIKLQAVCDDNRKFLDVFAGCPGRMHDGRVFEYSDLSNEIFQHVNSRYHILGDGAYLIREWLLTPYRNLGNLTPQQNLYNETLSRTRVRIENAFGLLQARFRQLRYGIDMHKVPKISKFIVACCVLHNLCINDPRPPQLEREAREIVQDNNADELHELRLRERQLKRRGERKRDRIQNNL